MIQLTVSYPKSPPGHSMSEKVLHCRDVLKQLTDFLEGDLDLEDRLLLEHHIAACPSCRKALEELRHTISLLNRLPKPKPRSVVRPNSNDDTAPA